MTQWTMAGHMAVALALGALIGLERQWRARMAGLRTNALVAAGSALFVLLSQFGFLNGQDRLSVGYDGSRVAAQIVSGIGFLGAGVILRDGLNVRGLNTAATLWCSAAVGSLAGAGLFRLAALGTLGVIGANIVLRPIGRRVNREHMRRLREDRDAAVTDYLFTAVCAEVQEAHVRALLVQATMTHPELRLRAVHSRNTEAPGQVAVSAEFTARARDDGLLEQAVSQLSLLPDVTAVSWSVIDEDDTDASDDDSDDDEGYGDGEDEDRDRRRRRTRRDRVRSLLTGTDR